MLAPLVRSMRPLQWAKNLFVLAPAIFAAELTDPVTLGRALLAFAAFSAASSGVYLINDVRDREADRLHPLKKHRPIAAGTLPAPVAVTMAVALFAGALAGAWALSAATALFVALYAILNTGYSLGLKHVVIVDVMVIALGFVLRVLGGGAAVEVVVSRWLVLCTIFLALFLALSKRRHEIELLAHEAPGQRRVLSSYSPAFLDQMINVVTASAVVSYALYATAPETAARFGTDSLVYTLPLVLFGVFRYLYLIYQAPEEKNPTEALMGDWPFLLNMALWGLVVLGIIYL